MMMNKLFFLLLIAIVLTGCAGDANQEIGASAGDDSSVSAPSDRNEHDNLPSTSAVGRPIFSVVSCIQSINLEICAGKVTTDQDGAHVPVKVRILDEQLQLIWPFIGGDSMPPEDSIVFLADDQGKIFNYIPDPFLPEPQVNGPVHGSGDWAEQVLDFAAVPPDVVSLKLHIPVIVVSAPVDGDIDIDLGPDPRAGSVFHPDATIQVAGQIIRFDRAEIDSQYYLHVYSAPIEPEENIIVRWLETGMPEGWSAGIGPGNKYNFETRIQHLWFPMTKSDGMANTGIISIPVYVAQLYLIGPFEIALPVP